jgi:hypothetical protein
MPTYIPFRGMPLEEDTGHTRLRAGAVYTTNDCRMKQVPWNVYDEEDEEQSLREAVKRLEARIAEVAEEIRELRESRQAQKEQP